MLSSRDILTRSGTVSVEIDTTATDEITVSKLGSIVFENDIDRGEQTVNTLSTSYGAISVEFWDNTLNQVSLFDTIRANSADNIPARVIIEQDGVSYDFPFTVRKSQIEYDERAGITTIQFAPPVFPDIGTQALIDASSATEVWEGGPDGRFNCLTVFDFIKECLSRLGSPTNYEIIPRPIQQNYVFGGENYRLESIYDDDPINVDRISFVITRRVNASIPQTFMRLASLNSCAFGSAFSTGFFVPKNNTDNPVTISVAKIDNLSIVPSSRSIRDISLSLVNTFANSNILPNTEAAVVFAGIGADREIKYVHNVGDNFNIGVWDGTDINADATTISNIRSAPNAPPEFYLTGLAGTNGSISSIASVYGAGGNRIRISATINDFYTLKPWECFQFDTSVPVRYRNRIYRPSLLEYDLISGIIKLTAYSIT